MGFWNITNEMITEFIQPASPLTYAVPVFAVLILIELLYSLKNDKGYFELKDFFSSLTMGIGSAFIGAFIKGALWSSLIFVYLYFNPKDPTSGIRYNIMGWQSFGFAWYTWIACQFFDDFNYYWHHRFSHTVRVLWAAHIVHHSSDHYNLGTAVRNGWVTLFYKPIWWMWMPAIGFHPAMIFVCLGIQSIWQFQLHTKHIPRLGKLELFMNSHKQHMAHHSTLLKYLDTNHGGFLNIFDKLFGTWKDLENEEENKYGVLHPPKSYNPLVIVSHEYRDIWNDVKKSKNLKEAFMYVFGPPGWSSDGSSQTVKQMQRELKAQEAKKAA